MNTTTNYGLKLYEGTDLFNPLTVENVNTGDIDAAMKAISDHSVGTATELTTGTVHALTRADTGRNVFLFVATSNFTAGDTFTLDGNQVSALTPDGQQLASGSYVIGSSVLCALHDTLITVYVNPAKSKDSDMLDGHDSSYYATDDDLDTVAGNVQALSNKVGASVLITTASNCSDAINELKTDLDPKLNINFNWQSAFVDITNLTTTGVFVDKDSVLFGRVEVPANTYAVFKVQDVDVATLQHNGTANEMFQIVIPLKAGHKLTMIYGGSGTPVVSYLKPGLIAD